MRSVLTPVNRVIIGYLAESRSDVKWMIAKQRRYVAALDAGESLPFAPSRDWRRSVAQVCMRSIYSNPWLLLAPLGAAVLYIVAAVFHFIW